MLYLENLNGTYEQKSRKFFADSHPLKAITSSFSHTLYLLEDGTVFQSDQSVKNVPEQMKTLQAQRIEMIAAGHSFSAVLNKNGQVFVWGTISKKHDELKFSKPTRIKIGDSAAKVVKIAAGWHFMLLLTDDAKVYAMGRNEFGQLGVGNTERQTRPVLVESLHGLPVCHIACGAYHSIVLTASGFLFSFGRNDHGQLGLAGTHSRHTPVNLKYFNNLNVSYVSCGKEFSAVLFRDGSLYMFGSGRYGQLGAIGFDDQFIPSRVFALIGSEVTQTWLADAEANLFKRLINAYKKIIVYILKRPRFTVHDSLSNKLLDASLRFLQHLHRINTQVKELVAYDSFYIGELVDKVNLKSDYALWSQLDSFAEQQKMILFSAYPFLFDARAKSLLFQVDSDKQMNAALQNAPKFSKPFLCLKVRRDFLVQDALKQLAISSQAQLKLRLKVAFVNEEARDAGGVRKEFFMLLRREILDAKYGMFTYYHETGTVWFAEQTLESIKMYNLIGKLYGLAVYNSILIDLPFPLVLYKKILKEKATLSDLFDLEPSVARSLEMLLEYDNDDFEETFCLNFEISRQRIDSVVENVELVPGGSKKPVTKLNVKEYVECYIDYVFNKSVKAAFGSFFNGFSQVCCSEILKLFRPSEMMAMVVGNQDYDFDELKKNADYGGEYSATHFVVQNFWSVLEEFDLEQKKKFLTFLTGTDRVTIFGMRHLRVFIESTSGGDEYFPAAHTCFNTLDLPKYSTRQLLNEKLLVAIEHNRGFTLV